MCEEKSLDMPRLRELFEQLDQRLMSEHDLITASCIFKYIERYGLEGTKAVIQFERAGREFLNAYRRKSALCTNSDE